MTLVDRRTGEVLVLPGDVSDVALQLPDDLTFDEWAEYGARLGRVTKSCMWWLGDWWRYGDHKYGERAAAVLDSDTFAYDTFAKAGWVAGRIETWRRRQVLSFGHHDAVAALEPVHQDELLDMAETEGWSVRELRQETRRRRNGHEQPVRDVVVGTFPTIVIDPPWRYDNVATRGAAEDHYPTMSDDELHALTIPAAEDAHLYLWVTNGFIREGFDLCAHWGFTYKALLTWCKPQIGMGNWFRNTTEHVIFGVRGKLPTNRNDVPTHFVANRTKHSAKPESFYDLVESCSPGPYLEMFARRRRMGWESWGDEA